MAVEAPKVQTKGTSRNSSPDRELQLGVMSTTSTESSTRGHGDISVEEKWKALICTPCRVGPRVVHYRSLAGSRVVYRAVLVYKKGALRAHVLYTTPLRALRTRSSVVYRTWERGAPPVEDAVLVVDMTPRCSSRSGLELR